MLLFEARNRQTEVVDEELRQRHGVAGAKLRGFCDRLDMRLPGEATVYLHRRPLLAIVEGNNGFNEISKKGHPKAEGKNFCHRSPLSRPNHTELPNCPTGKSGPLNCDTLPLTTF